jgi:adenylate cyclase
MLGDASMAVDHTPRAITIDLRQFKLHLALEPPRDLTLHFNSPSRRFYLCVIALVVHEMKRQGRITSIPLSGQHAVLALLNETVGGAAGSSVAEPMLSRIYRKWQHALPNLEEAPLFQVLGHKKGTESGGGRAYPLTDAEKDRWANLFEYQGSHAQVRLKFAVDALGASLQDIVIRYEDAVDAEAWARFLASLSAQAAEPEAAALDRQAAEAPGMAAPPVGPTRSAERGRYLGVAQLAVLGVWLGLLVFTLGKSWVQFAPGPGASQARMAFPLPAWKPSIAMLPFANLSGDPTQAFLSDGLSEAILTAMAKLPSLVVIGGSLTAPYRRNPGQVGQVSEALGVRYVLAGGVQRVGDQVRITTQLLEARTGVHVWANRYEREPHDLFALQDEITLDILANLQATLFSWEKGLPATLGKYYRGKRGLDCYLKLENAWEHMGHWNIRENNVARRLTGEAIALCPENPAGYVALGWIYNHDYVLGNTRTPRETLAQSVALAQKTLAMDETQAMAHILLSDLYSRQVDHTEAIVEAQRAVALSPEDAVILQDYGNTLIDARRPAEALPVFQKAIHLTPFGPADLYRAYGRALRDTGRFEEAVAAYQQAIRIAPGSIPNHAGLATVYIWMGREREARAEAAEVLRIDPRFSVETFTKRVTAPDQAARDRYAAALRHAGLK